MSGPSACPECAVGHTPCSCAEVCGGMHCGDCFGHTCAGPSREEWLSVALDELRDEVATLAERPEAARHVAHSVAHLDRYLTELFPEMARARQERTRDRLDELLARWEAEDAEADADEQRRSASMSYRAVVTDPRARP